MKIKREEEAKMEKVIKEEVVEKVMDMLIETIDSSFTMEKLFGIENIGDEAFDITAAVAVKILIKQLNDR